MNRPSWHLYFLAIANVVRMRSPDQQTRHGCLIVDSNRRIISLGYNGFPAGFPDSELPATRPNKYPFMVHAEANALLFAKRDLVGCFLYVTGFPCVDCTKMILQSGIKNIICLDRNSKCLGDNYEELFNAMCKYGNVNVKLISIETFKSFLKEYEQFFNPDLLEI
jgi:dCMP deaminase